MNTSYRPFPTDSFREMYREGKFLGNPGFPSEWLLEMVGHWQDRATSLPWGTLHL